MTNHAWNMAELLCDGMKVLVLAPPLESAGGIQRYTGCLVRALQEALGDQNVRCLAIPGSTNAGGHGRFSAGLKLRFGWQALGDPSDGNPI